MKIELFLKLVGGLGVPTFGLLIAAVLLDKTKDELPTVLLWSLLIMLGTALLAKLPMVFGQIRKSLNMLSLATLVLYWVVLYFCVALGKLPLNDKIEGNIFTPILLLGLSLYWWMDLLTLYGEEKST